MSDDIAQKPDLDVSGMLSASERSSANFQELAKDLDNLESLKNIVESKGGSLTADQNDALTGLVSEGKKLRRQQLADATQVGNDLDDLIARARALEAGLDRTAVVWLCVPDGIPARSE